MAVREPTRACKHRRKHLQHGRRQKAALKITAAGPPGTIAGAGLAKPKPLPPPNPSNESCKHLCPIRGPNKLNSGDWEREVADRARMIEMHAF